MQKKTKILIIALVLLAILLIILCNITLKNIQAKTNCVKGYLEFAEKNEEQIFTITRITYFSSCNAEISTNSNSSFTIKDLYQYTDIAIFIDNNSDELTAQNTLKSVNLCNITFSLRPDIGTPNLYYKNINDFANPTYKDEDKINDSINFDTTSENELDYSKPILYNNCANPITLCYVNNGIKDKYTLSNQISDIAHNGSLLKTCNITLNSIACNICFDIEITNNLDEVFTCPVTLSIPLSTESSTIYDGSLTFKASTNYNFIRK